MMERVFRFEPADWGTYRDALMAIENTCFHENLRETTSEKRRLLSRRGMLTLLYDAGGVIGECYGIPLKNTGRLVHDIATYSRFGKQPDAFYSYSTAVFPEQQGKGVATHLKRSQIAHARAEGFRYLTGHAREGAMMHLAEKMGAKIVKEYPNWYDTGATNYLYEIDMDGINVVLPLKQQDSGCGPACLQSGIRYLGGPSIEQTRIAEIAGTTDDAGTPPHKMVTGARQLGYRAEFERRCSFDDITAALKQGRVPIVSWFSVYTPHWSVVDTCENGQLRIMDPEDGSFKIFPYEDFNKVWFSYPATQSISGENLRIRPMLVLGKK